jgi:hypothetical protein
LFFVDALLSITSLQLSMLWVNSFLESIYCDFRYHHTQKLSVLQLKLRSIETLKQKNRAFTNASMLSPLILVSFTIYLFLKLGFWQIISLGQGLLCFCSLMCECKQSKESRKKTCYLYFSFCGLESEREKSH